MLLQQQPQDHDTLYTEITWTILVRAFSLHHTAHLKFTVMQMPDLLPHILEWSKIILGCLISCNHLYTGGGTELWHSRTPHNHQCSCWWEHLCQFPIKHNWLLLLKHRYPIGEMPLIMEFQPIRIKYLNRMTEIWLYSSGLPDMV